MKPSVSAKSNAREFVHKAYRARGHRFNNLWLVYSPKTDRDWLLNSDLQYVYWLRFLEADSAVGGFEILERQTAAPDFLVHYRDGSSEVHFVKSNNNDAPELYQLDGKYLPCKSFDYEKVDAVAIEALRWAKPLGFAASIRGEECISLMNAVAFYFHRVRVGTVGEVVAHLEEYDRAEVVGVIVRQHAKGLIKFSLESHPFSLNTIWESVA
jgi:hypothetical protein